MNSSKIEILIIGAGYVGLVTGACLAELGHSILLVDKDMERLNRIRQSEPPFYEPQLATLVSRHVKSGRLCACDLKTGLRQQPHLIMIAVGTPELKTGECDLRAFHGSVDEILELLPSDSRSVLVIKSTVPVGTARLLWKKLVSTHPHVSVASNPEFLCEGSAIESFFNPDRIVIGSEHPDATAFMNCVYQPLIRNGARYFIVSHESAELAKYASNFMLASRISAINQVAVLAGAVGANIKDIQRIVGSDRRIGAHYLSPGLGYGGSCFPKDLRALIAMCRKNCVCPEMVEAVESFNQKQQFYLIDPLKARVPVGADIAVLGLSFKPDTDDVRHSTAAKIVPLLIRLGYKPKCHDPKAISAFRRYNNGDSGGKVGYCESYAEAMYGSKGLFVLTEWPEYQFITPVEAAALMAQRCILDGRNIYDESVWKARGFEYYGVGVPR